MAVNSPTSTSVASQPSQEQITERARKLWIERGSPGGRDLEHWLEAERQLREERSAPSSRVPKPSSSAPPGGKRRTDLYETEKRLDGLIEKKPSPARRTPSGEQL